MAAAGAQIALSGGRETIDERGCISRHDYARSMARPGAGDGIADAGHRFAVDEVGRRAADYHAAVVSWVAEEDVGSHLIR